MMKKAPTNTMIKKIRTNVIILLTALVFAVAVFYVKNNPDIFLASILSLQQQQYITEKGRDAAYSTYNRNFEIFLAEKYTGNVTKFQGMVYLDPKKVELYVANFTGQGDIDLTWQDDATLMISITDLHDINVRQEILGIPFSGDAGLVFLGEANGRRDLHRKAFSVGNLSKF